MVSESVILKNTEYDEISNIQKCLSNMTGNELCLFINMYQLVISSDPNADRIIDKVCTEKACMDKLKNGEILNAKDFNSMLIENEKKSKSLDEKDINDFANSNSLLEAHNVIEKWKKRIEPKINNIKNIVKKCEKIVQQKFTENSLNNDKELNYNNQSEQAIENDNASNSRYLSNIDNSLNSYETIHSELNNISDQKRDMKEKITQINVKSRKTLLIPSKEYLKFGYPPNIDELKVKTYFIDEN